MPEREILLRPSEAPVRAKKRDVDCRRWAPGDVTEVHTWISKVPYWVSVAIMKGVDAHQPVGTTAATQPSTSQSTVRGRRSSGDWSDRDHRHPRGGGSRYSDDADS